MSSRTRSFHSPHPDVVTVAVTGAGVAVVCVVGVVVVAVCVVVGVTVGTASSSILARSRARLAIRQGPAHTRTVGKPCVAPAYHVVLIGPEEACC